MITFKNALSPLFMSALMPFATAIPGNDSAASTEMSVTADELFNVFVAMKASTVETDLGG